MFTQEVEGRLAWRTTAVRLYKRELRVAGMAESDVEQRIAPIYTRYPDAQTTILASPGEVQIHLRAWSADATAAEKLLKEMVERIVMALGENIFTTKGESLEEGVARDLNLNGATIAVADSCTGGSLSQRLTSSPVSSAHFLRGAPCYRNDLTRAWWDLPPAQSEA